MAMSTGGDPANEVPKADINVTPLADVMLVLLIIFMITAPLMTHKIQVPLPQANPHTKPVPVSVPPIDLAVQADGDLYWNDNPVDSALFRAKLRVAATDQPQPALNIRADKATPYRIIWSVMQDAKTAGMVHIGFITNNEAHGGRGP
ncbi:MAG TPA: biopolymer transporter ExbD [Rhodanobacteraceae bacterium]|nr:biopolymer transporter ExbD [Rhodanobacteraceae bacterium]